MKYTLAQASEAELLARRSAIRRGLLRANTVAVAVAVVVMALAVVAIFQANRAETSARKARENSEKLLQSLPAQLRGSRSSGNIGWRRDVLASLAAAARIDPSAALRDEAIALLADVDLQPECEWGNGLADHLTGFDPALEHYFEPEPDGAIGIHTVADNRLVTRLPSQKARVLTACFSHRGDYLAVRYADEQLIVWDWRTGQTLFRRQIEHDQWRTGALAFSPDDKMLAVSNTGDCVRIYALPAGEETRRLDGIAGCYTLEFDPAGERLAVGFNLFAQVWDWRQGKRLRSFEHEGFIHRVTWHPLGEHLAAAGDDSNVHLHHVESGRRRTLAGHSRESTGVLFNHKGDMLASTSHDGTTRLWEFASGRTLLTTHRGYAVQFSPDDGRLGFWKRFGIGTWQVVPAPVHRTFLCPAGPDHRVRTVAVDPTGRWLVASNVEGVRIWDMDQNRLVLSDVRTEANDVQFHPVTGALIVAAAGGLWEYARPNPESGDAFGAARPLFLALTNRTERFTFAPDGRSVAALLGAGRVQQFSSEGAILADFVWPGSQTISFGSDQRWLAASGTWIGTRIFDTATGQPIKTFKEMLGCSAFSHDGRRFITSDQQAFNVWATDTWKISRRIPRDALQEGSGPFSLAGDGRLAALAITQRRVQIYDVQAGKEVAHLTPPMPQAMSCLAYGGGDRFLAAGTEDGFVQLWDLNQLRRELGQLHATWGKWEHLPEGGPPAPMAGGSAGRPGGLVALVGIAATLALALALVALRQHRKLVEAYVEIEGLAAQRNQQLESAQSELFHGQKMRALGTLAAGIAHDFNNLLSVVRMANKLTGREAPDNAEVQDNVRIVEKAVTQGKHVVNSMLGYSRGTGESGTQIFVPELVEGAVILLSQQFLGGVQLNLDLDREAPPVKVPRGLLEQILLNLVVNASEAMNGQGNLRISARIAKASGGTMVLRPTAANRYVELVVADSGPGIPAEIRDRIFEPFFSTKDTGATRGTGLGLSLVYSLARQDGLGLQMESELGKGTTFRVLIPAAEVLNANE